MSFIPVKYINFNKKGKKFKRHLLKFMMMIDKKKFKPVIFLIPENTDDLFVDVEHLQIYKEFSPMCGYFYQGLVLGFGKNVFVFDVESCDYFNNSS